MSRISSPVASSTPKTALADADAAEAVGRLFLADISVPALVYERLGLACKTPFTRRPVVELVERIRR